MSIWTPFVCACGCSDTVHVPAPSPASDIVISCEVRCAPLETSIRWNESDCGTVNTLGSSAARTFARPEPSRSTDASWVLAVSCHAAPAVDISADLTSTALHVGWRWRSSAAAPATCGVAIDVPAKTENGEPVVSGGVDESTSRPGAEMSGLRNQPKSVGPAEEKLVMIPLRPVWISWM